MKRFKLIKRYPGCTWLDGEIITENNINGINDTALYDHLCNEKYTEFWQELKYKAGDKVIVTDLPPNNNNMHHWIHDTNQRIFTLIDPDSDNGF